MACASAARSAHRPGSFELMVDEGGDAVWGLTPRPPSTRRRDRKSTRLNSSHTVISYAVFCLKKKKKDTRERHRVPAGQAGEDNDEIAKRTQRQFAAATRRRIIWAAHALRHEQISLNGRISSR